MSDLIRDAPLGQIIRFVTRNRMFQYPEERADFECPASYSRPDESHSEAEDVPPVPEIPKEFQDGSNSPKPGNASDPEKDTQQPRMQDLEKAETEKDTPDLEKMQTAKSTKTNRTTKSTRSVVSARSAKSVESIPAQDALKQARTRSELEHQLSNSAIGRQASVPIAPAKLDDGTILVDWYDTADSQNPQNWSFGKKLFVLGLICLYTLAVYMGSAIYTPSITGVTERFGVSITVAELGLSLYVLAYGIGPMFFSPISEIPVVGRNPPYIITFAIFVILCVPTALVDNVAGLLVLRFLQGFFGSPCLATGGASMGDLYSLIKLPYAICLWALAATCGPALGPMISGFSVQAENWRWSLWEMLWLAGPIWIMLFLFMPETSGPNILLRRAARLRKLTGDNRLKSQSEIDQANLNSREIAIEALWRPIQLMLLDPAIAYTAVYVALLYGIYYSFFEAFPLVYLNIYGFNIGQMGLTFLSITVAVILSIAIYWAYIYWIIEPGIKKHGLGAPERRLIPAMYSSVLCPIGLFMWAWTSRSDIHWIVSVIGIGIFTVGVFILIQCIFIYLPFVYPQYAASLFAGNDLARSTLAAGSVLFARPLFVNLGIGNGVSLLGALTAFFMLGVFGLFFYGDKLRARSKFSAKY
ncbi:MAG: hypothetical protein M1820_000103 [Bogoriella megaspora]|nr:MAG: hypothetical protein M1820_000103 [Bogoriella megaspora]